jgi:hypothetical protein
MKRQVAEPGPANASAKQPPLLRRVTRLNRAIQDSPQELGLRCHRVEGVPIEKSIRTRMTSGCGLSRRVGKAGCALATASVP